jgi:hypothetical protein
MELKFSWDTFIKSDAVDKNSKRPSIEQKNYSKKSLATQISKRNQNLGFVVNPIIGDRYANQLVKLKERIEQVK